MPAESRFLRLARTMEITGETMDRPHDRSAHYPLCRQFEISDEEISRRLEMLGVTHVDEECLDQLRQILAENVERLVSDFYEYLQRFSELARFISNAERSRRLRTALSEYLMTFGKNVRTLEYFEGRLRVGIIHEKNGISHKLYIAGCARLRAAIIEQIQARRGLPASTEVQMLISFHKLLGLDVELALETYHRTAVSRIEALMRQLESGQDEIRRVAQTDQGTGLLNRRHFLDCLESELHRCQRYGRPLSVLLIDLDDFKGINDRFGHHMGDAVLKAIGEILPSQVRRADLCGRLGGGTNWLLRSSRCLC